MTLIMASNVLSVVIILGLAFLVLSWFKTRHRNQVAKQWPVLSATVETVNHVNRGHYTNVYDVDVGYSYGVDRAFYSGESSIPGSWWRTPPTTVLVGSTIQVRVNPQDPSESVIVSTSLPGIDNANCPPLLGRGSNR
jgi:hypothetical protein